jgi:hypothetical protein
VGTSAEFQRWAGIRSVISVETSAQGCSPRFASASRPLVRFGLGTGERNEDEGGLTIRPPSAVAVGVNRKLVA